VWLTATGQRATDTARAHRLADAQALKDTTLYQEVGRLLADTVRESDVAARAGGEEFCILLPDTDLDGTLDVAQKLRAAIARLEVPGEDATITGSFGVATFPLHAMDTPTLLRKSDRALYVAKQHGRDRVEAATVHGAQARALAEDLRRVTGA